MREYRYEIFPLSDTTLCSQCFRISVLTDQDQIMFNTLKNLDLILRLQWLLICFAVPKRKFVVSGHIY